MSNNILTASDINTKIFKSFINTKSGLDIWYDVITSKNNTKLEFDYPMNDLEFTQEYEFFVYRNLSNNLFCSTFFNLINRHNNELIKNCDYKNFLRPKPNFYKYCNIISDETFSFKPSSNTSSKADELHCKVYTLKDFEKNDAYYLIYVEREKFIQKTNMYVGRNAILEIIKKNDIQEIENYLNSF